MKNERNRCNNNYAMYCVSRKKQDFKQTPTIFGASQIPLVTFATFASSDITS